MCSEDKKTLLHAMFIFIAFALLYIIFFSTTYFRDSFIYAVALEDNSIKDRFPPQHLLYVLSIRCFYEIWVFLGYRGGALFPLQVFTALFGALGVSSLFILTRDVTKNAVIALFASLLLGFSYGFWRYSIEAMPYVTAISLLICSSTLLVGVKERSSHKSFFILGLLTSLATFFHQLSALFVFVLAIAIWTIKESLSSRIKYLLIYLSTAVVVVVGAYIIVGWGILRLHTVRDLVYFMTDRLHSSLLALAAGHGRLSLTQPFKAMIGIGNLFVGEVFVAEYLLSTTPDYFERIFLLSPSGAPQAYRAVQPTAGTYVLFLLTAIVVLSMVIASLYAFIFRKRIWRSYPGLLMICVTWIAIFGLFVFWYVPQNRQWWLFILPALCILFALVLKDAQENLSQRLSPRKQYLFTSLFMLSLFSVNFFGSILPSHDPNTDKNLALTQMIAPCVQEGDLVFTLDRGEYKNALPYINYFNRADVASLRLIFLSPDGDRYRMSYQHMIRFKFQNGHQVYVIADVFRSEIGYKQIAMHTAFTKDQVRQSIIDFFADYELDLILSHDGEPLLYEVKPRIRG